MPDYSKCPLCGGNVYSNFKYQIDCGAPVGGCLKTRYIAENEAIHNAIHDRIEAARQEERERCVKICEEVECDEYDLGNIQASNGANTCADRIRARGK